MKTKSYIATILFAGMFSTALAAGDSAPSTAAFTTDLAPVVPVEATFEEDPPAAPGILNWLLNVLAPETPRVAEFNDDTTLDTVDLEALQPTVPPEADFSDSF